MILCSKQLEQNKHIDHSKFINSTQKKLAKDGEYTVDNNCIRHEHGEPLSDRDIQSVIDDIGTLFDDNAKNVFGTKSSLSHDDSNVRPEQTPWFNSKCSISRKDIHEARKTYSTYKTNGTHNNMNLASRE